MDKVDLSAFSYADLLALKNAVNAAIDRMGADYETVAIVLVVFAVNQLLDGCGDGYVDADYYAPARYYLNSHGIKNVRILPPVDVYEKGNKRIVVKAYDKRGLMVPDTLKIRDAFYDVSVVKSKNFKNEVNY